MGKLTFQFTNPVLYDRLYTLSVEYDTDMEILINIAVKRLLDDVELIRDLRAGKIKDGGMVHN